MWFLDDQARFATERTAIHELEESSTWLQGVAWGLTENGLYVDVIIRVHDTDYPIRMIYPAHFPFTPPIVRPQDSDVNWSTHQYVNGVLCLEWGPDNWHPSVTGSQVLESAYRLLFIEKPLGSQEQIVAPSRHELTFGQELRSQFGRFYIGKLLTDALDSLPKRCSGKFKFSTSIRKESFLVLIHQVEKLDGTFLRDDALPEGLHSNTLNDGYFFKTSLSPEAIEACREYQQIEALLRGEKHTLDLDKLLKDLPAGLAGLAIIDSSNQYHCFFIFQNQEQNITTFHLTRVEDKSGGKARVPSNLETLFRKTIGIVGLGSVGSKVALALARTGIKNFMLVDHDIFLPGNICRHPLDWRDICEHKVDAVKRQLTHIAPGVNVETSRLHLTGQESTAALNNTLTHLTKCDLIVDATASSSVFNLLAAVSTKTKTPLVWMEVYAGGIGGMIARSRPCSDPDPYAMKHAYFEVLSKSNEPNIKTIDNYLAHSDENEVMIATDADVSIIASYAIKLVLDSLLPAEQSQFPHSMYMIGLAGSWVFNEPLHNIHIDTSNLPTDERLSGPIPEPTTETAEFLASLLK